MQNVQWDESLSIGVTLVDEQHKALIQRLNRVSAAVEVREGPTEIIRTLGFLTEYTDYHFATEEKHMAATQYPGLSLQEQKHQEFRDTLAGLRQDFEEEGSTQGLAESVNTLLWNWLVKHICDVDQQFGAFLAEKGIEISEEG